MRTGSSQTRNLPVEPQRQSSIYKAGPPLEVQRDSHDLGGPFQKSPKRVQVWLRDVSGRSTLPKEGKNGLAFLRGNREGSPGLWDKAPATKKRKGAEKSGVALLVQPNSSGLCPSEQSTRHGGREGVGRMPRDTNPHKPPRPGTSQMFHGRHFLHPT